MATKNSINSVASSVEVNILDGATLSTAELNILDGVTATTAEINHIDGVTSPIQTQLDWKVDENGAITGATKTKITYDTKGLVTAGADATTADIADSTNKRYVTDAQLTVIWNTSWTNTWDQTNISGNAATVTTNANLSGHVTSVGNTTSLGSFTISQLNTAISDANLIPEAGGTFTWDIVVPAEAYGSWRNGSNEVPTKNDVYDKIETLSSSGLTQPQVMARAFWWC